MNHYPVLYFMIAGNHLYPIEDQPTQMSISQINSKCGGKPFTKTTELVKPDNSKIQILYKMYHLRCFMNNPEFKGYRIICQELGWVDQLFVSFAQKGNLYNTGIRVSNHRVTRFETDGMIIEENTQYSAAQATIDTLNDGIQSDKDILLPRAILTLISNCILP